MTLVNGGMVNTNSRYLGIRDPKSDNFFFEKILHFEIIMPESLRPAFSKEILIFYFFIQPKHML